MKRTTSIWRLMAVVCAAALCVLTLSAFAASSASAKGLTAFTCVKGAGVLNGAHCLGTSAGEYGHVEIKGGEETTGTATNANTAEETIASRKSILKGSIAGVVAEIHCTEVTGTFTMENKTTVPLTGEMYAHGVGSLRYSGCLMTKPKNCQSPVVIPTKELTGTTEGIQTAEPPHTLLVKSAIAGPLAEIEVIGCANEELNGIYPVTGSLKAKISGATVTAAHADITTQNALKFGGQKAGLDGAVTLRAHKVPKEGETVEETKPLTVTTE